MLQRFTKVIGLTFLICVLNTNFTFAQNVDLSLNISTSNSTYIQYGYLNLSFTLTNNGATASGVKVGFEIPEGTAFSSSEASAGNYSTWNHQWDIGTVPAGATITNQMVLFVLAGSGNINAFAQVIQASPNDIDSNPNNNFSNVPIEDDESALTFVPQGNGGGTNGAVTLNDFPIDRQLYTRSVSTNRAQIPVSGSIAQSAGFSRVRLKVFKNGTLQNSIDQNLGFSNGSANFNFNSVFINAELSNHTIELFGVVGTNETYLASAEKVVAGDVYIINGQSNAEAAAAAHQSDLSEYSRSYNAEFGWNYLNYSMPGLWGGRLAKDIIDEQGIPVAIFNQAVGAQQIAFFLKNDSNPLAGNYGTLMTRLSNAGIDGNIRAAIWFQGEADGWQTSLQDYKNMFIDLCQDWKADYGIDKCYLYQIRFESCTHPLPLILESQRQLANENFDIEIMSTSNADHDGCHFAYYNGYQDLADRLYLLMAKNLYGSGNNTIVPDVTAASVIPGNKILIETSNQTGLQRSGFPWGDFSVEGSNLFVSSGYVEGNNIVLQLNGDPSQVTGVTYLAHKGNAPDWIYNSAGIGLLSFYDFPMGEVIDNPDPPVDPPTTGGVDLELNQSSSNLEFIIYEDINLSLEVVNNGDATATGIVVSDVVPEGSAFSSGATSQGQYSAWNGDWLVGTLGAGQSATIDLTLFVLQDNNNISNFAQVSACNETDADSSPGNNFNNNPSEDDESVLVFVPAGSGPGDPEPPTSGGPDLELTMSAQSDQYIIYENSTFEIKIKNSGTETMSGIKVKEYFPEGLVYSDHQSSQGNFDPWTGEWSIPSLAVGEEEILNLELFSLVGNQSLVNYAEITAASPNDTDSTPNNGTPGQANEDDEAIYTINPANNAPVAPYRVPVFSSQNRFIVLEKMYPVPTTDYIFLGFSANTSKVLDLEIFDANLRSVLKMPLNINEGYNELPIEVANLAAGTYQILIHSGTSHESIRFIKHKL